VTMAALLDAALFLVGLVAGAAGLFMLTRTRFARGAALAAELDEARRALAEARRALDDAQRTDVLTGLANRRLAEERLAEEWRRLARTHGPLSLLLVEIDHFKPYNTAYGARQGDACLQRVAASFGTSVGRAGDLAARWGGEKFVVLLPETSADGAATVAENLRARVEALGIPHETSRRKVVTISIGYATSAPASAEASPHTLVTAADEALQRAKRGGRNRVEP